MKDLNTTTKDSETILRQLFGDNRAEWASEHFRNLFVSPAYLQKLRSARPCFLIGGRGTGKTTSLQSLKYDSALEQLEDEGLDFSDLEYLGILVRMNKNRVRAFEGEQLSQEDWRKAFAHYFNLLACLEFTGLCIWLEERQEITATSDLINNISLDLGLAELDTLEELKKGIKKSISKLQIYVNNPKSTQNIIFSIAEAPLRTYVEAISEWLSMDGRIVFCCIDEYENLLDYQQAILNTYIKHASPPLSYKVGVRKNGLRNRSTLDGNDLLRTPDDYADIEIADEGFNFFAKEVAELRLKYAKDKGINVPTSLDYFLQDLSFSEEAEKLGAHKIADEILKELKECDLHVYDHFNRLSKSEFYFLRYWQEGNGGELLNLAKDWLANQSAWKTRIGNHGYASLFWLSKGNKGARIRKYYSGSRVLLSLPAGNIRFFLDLIDTAIGYELKEISSIDNNQMLIVSPRSQTLAVRDVGERRLNQLEGLADQGVQLKRLVLAIGKVFFEYARSPAGKTPEVTSFVLNGEGEDLEKIEPLLNEGVGHLAFEVAPRTKATSNTELRDNEYRLHRIFCGFFEISHRKKRRTTFEAKNLLSVLSESPGRAISALLEGKSQSDDEELPKQLAFFSSFYDDRG